VQGINNASRDFRSPRPIGKSIADALHARGMAYRAIGHDRARLESAFGADPLMELMTWDPDDAASVQAGAAGIDTLIFCVGVPSDTESFRGDFGLATLHAVIASFGRFCSSKFMHDRQDGVAVTARRDSTDIPAARSRFYGSD
jgi:hypothetical protein